MSCAAWEASGPDFGQHNADGCLALHATVPMRVPQFDGTEALLDLDAAGVLEHLDDRAHPWDGIADTMMRRLLFANVCEGGVIEGDTSGEIGRAFALLALDQDLTAFGGMPAAGPYAAQPETLLRALRLIRSTRNMEEARVAKAFAARHGGGES